ncbi:MAG: outer membrane beta-barrel protein [Parvibaculum sp.]
MTPEVSHKWLCERADGLSSLSFPKAFPWVGLALLLVLGGTQGASQALAEDVRGQGVAERQYEDFSAPGVRLGSFVLRPSLTVSETYDSNVFAASTGAQDDVVTNINPNVTLTSDWSNHEVRLEADINQSLYARHDDENVMDWRVSASGRIDVLSTTSLRGSVAYATLSEERGATDAIGNAAEPTEFTEAALSLGVRQEFNRLSGDVSAIYTELDFDDTPLIGGGVSDNDDRDRSLLEVAVEIGYELVADTVVFLRGTYNTRDYDLKPPAVALNRDSDGYQLVAGSRFELGSLARGEVFAGYQEQEFDNPLFAPVSGIAFGASVDWFVTPLTTLRFTADSAIEDTNSGTASSFERMQAGVGLDHEFLRNLVASADFAYAQETFQGSNRKDEVYVYDLGLNYLIDRNFTIGAFVGLEERTSNVLADGFKRETVGIRVRSAL